MGISEACIRRPVMTTLITASLIVFGAFAYRLLSVSALPAVDFPTISITATLAGREPRDDGGLGRFADRAPALHHRRHQRADLDLGARHHHDHGPVRPQPQHRRRGARRADRADGRGAAPAGRNDDAAVLPQGESGRLPGAVHQPEFPDACRCRRSTNTARPCWRSRSRSFPASRRCWSMAGRSSPCASRPIRSRPRRATSRSRTSAPRSRRPTPTRRSAPSRASGRTSRSRPPRAISKAADYRKVIVAYRNGAPVKLDEIANVIDGVENTRIASFFNGNRSVVLAIQRQPDANTVAVVDSVKERIPAYRVADSGRPSTCKC